VFAFWDGLAGSLYVPKGRENLTFGLPDADPADFSTVRNLYRLPFVKARRMVGTRLGLGLRRAAAPRKLRGSLVHRWPALSPCSPGSWRLGADIRPGAGGDAVAGAAMKTVRTSRMLLALLLVALAGPAAAQPPDVASEEARERAYVDALRREGQAPAATDPRPP